MIDGISENLPAQLKTAIAPIYWRYQSRRADKEHKSLKTDLKRESNISDNVVVLVVDALRPDHTPELPIEFTTAITSSTWTFPSITSLHTGLKPSEHGSVAHTGVDDETYAMPSQTSIDPPLPYAMESAGYDTYAGCAFATPYLAIKGWYQTHRAYDDKNAERVIRDYLKWRENKENTFAYLHLGDLHAPIGPPEEYIKNNNVDLQLPDIRTIERYRTDFDFENPECVNYRENKLRLYQAALDYVSDCISTLIEEYDEDTTIFVVGDHGEAFWEHQEIDSQITDSRPNYSLGHGGTPLDLISRVPVGISTPGEIDLLPRGGWGSVRDIATTIVNEFTSRQMASGKNWRTEIPRDRAVVCEGVRYGVERKAVYKLDNKLIRSEADDITITSKIEDDREVFQELPDDVVAELIGYLPDEWGDGNVDTDTSEYVQSQLEALGYK